MSAVAGRSWEYKSTFSRIALVALLAVACSSDSDPVEPEPSIATLTGTWSRINSSFQELDGMLVVVDGRELEGVITMTPANVYMFQSGDIKWRDIFRTGDRDFDFEDLAREADTGEASYVIGRILVSAGGDSLSLSFPSTGTFQDWLRVN